jgi:acyl-CoA hydrolase
MKDVRTTPVFSDVESCVDAIIEKVGKNIVLGLPLGLGKPAHLANALYRRAKKNPDISLTIVTALSLEKPLGKSPLEKKFLEPFVARHFKGVPDLDYVLDLRRKSLPANVDVREFYFKAGSYLHHDTQQQNYISSNYTHAARDLMGQGVNVVAQMVGKRVSDGKTTYSFSCNADLSIDLEPMLHALQATGVPIAMIGEVNRSMPFMHNDAVIDGERFDMLIDNSEYDYPLFAVPNMAITPVDYLIGFYASTLLKDNGTLQVGIGSLGSALIYNTLMRHQQNDEYRALMQQLKVTEKFPVAAAIGGDKPFIEGLYGCSEMMVDGFLYLYKAGILKKQVFSDVRLQTLLNEKRLSTSVTIGALSVLAEAGVIQWQLRAKDLTLLQSWGVLTDNVELKGGSLVGEAGTIEADLQKPATLEWIKANCLGTSLKGGVVMHGGFFLGPKEMYQILGDFTAEDHQKFCMTSVNFINHLYDHFLGNQAIKVAQREHARLINSTMLVTLNGAAVSDGLANGQVISGVGGQFNFVAMAHEIPGGRSVLKFKSTRVSGGKVQSNVVFNYGYTTIPRHLRDIFITEYGIADVRGKSDKDVMIELIKIADSRFQDELLTQAKAAGKVPADYVLPDMYRNNTPEAIGSVLGRLTKSGLFPPFPFGCDFTQEELRIGKALKGLKAKTASRKGMIKAILKALKVSKDVPADIQPLLKRMDLENPQGLKEKLEQKLLISELLG